MSRFVNLDAMVAHALSVKQSRGLAEMSPKLNMISFMLLMCSLVQGEPN